MTAMTNVDLLIKKILHRAKENKKLFYNRLFHMGMAQIY